MRFLQLTLADIRFQIRYGFYLLYVILIVVYLIALFMLPEDIRQTVAVILVYSDPAAMGLFFMGSIVLLEKSQRVNVSLAVSPIKLWEYIGAKVISIGIIGSVVGGVISAITGIKNINIVLAGILCSSVLFSLCGLCVAMKIDTLNKFMLTTVPFEIVICIPAILYLLKLISSPWYILHPGIAAIELIAGDSKNLLLCIVSLIIWSFIVFGFSLKAVKKLFSEMGGGKL